ncbi:hypothetical protein [Sphaerisporangium sp. TRM90804]|uniref:hypothetical protein n=1 Tax=Sphaerisporangium sp. TRM90804 TaxID=3031113 RepID=UPI00244A5755|nr:hypothetical protein [Sphaerisporangium sp. TRM90804]MDH2430327.1 hypothetical protein [Sphaerisporangium sp. TRM90804]
MLSSIAAAAIAAAGTAFAVVLRLRTRRHRRTILSAASGMSDRLRAEALPQRVLLSQVAAMLVAQDEAAAGLESDIRRLPPGRAAEIEGLFSRFNASEEPTEPLARFLGGHACHSDPAALVAFTGDAVRRAAREVIGDERLHDLAAEGSARPVATAIVVHGLGTGGEAVAARPAPRLNGGDMQTAAKALDELTRRQIHLATLLHDQAEALLKVRPGILAKIASTLPIPRTPRHAIDLGGIQVALDAAGEVLDIAGDLVSADEPVRAVRILAGLHLPVPEGFPGRVFHRELLAQVRPLTEAGIRHRLSVAHWTVHIGRHLAGGAAP